MLDFIGEHSLIFIIAGAVIALTVIGYIVDKFVISKDSKNRFDSDDLKKEEGIVPSNNNESNETQLDTNQADIVSENVQLDSEQNDITSENVQLDSIQTDDQNLNTEINNQNISNEPTNTNIEESQEANKTLQDDVNVYENENQMSSEEITDNQETSKKEGNNKNQSPWEV